jgi:hypothetical protein
METDKKEDRMSGLIIYEAPDGKVRVDVRLDHETVWLTQDQMSQLFGRERSVIAKHIKNVFKEGELESASTCAKVAQVQAEGKRTDTREIDHYTSMSSAESAGKQRPDDPADYQSAGGTQRMNKVTESVVEGATLAWMESLVAQLSTAGILSTALPGAER